MAPGRWEGARERRVKLVLRRGRLVDAEFVERARIKLSRHRQSLILLKLSQCPLGRVAHEAVALGGIALAGELLLCAQNQRVVCGSRPEELIRPKEEGHDEEQVALHTVGRMN